MSSHRWLAVFPGQRIPKRDTNSENRGRAHRSHQIKMRDSLEATKPPNRKWRMNQPDHTSGTHRIDPTTPTSGHHLPTAPRWEAARSCRPPQRSSLKGPWPCWSNRWTRSRGPWCLANWLVFFRCFFAPWKNINVCPVVINSLLGGGTNWVWCFEGKGKTEPFGYSFLNVPPLCVFVCFFWGGNQRNSRNPWILSFLRGSPNR